MAQILLKDAFVLTMNDAEQVYETGSVLVRDDRIVAVGSVIDDQLLTDDTQVLNCSGKIIMPGLINTHVHTSQQLGRGLGDDVPLLTWLH